MCATTEDKFSKHVIYRLYNDSRELVFKNNYESMQNLIYLFENDVRHFAKLEVDKCTNKNFIQEITAKDCRELSSKNNRT